MRLAPPDRWLAVGVLVIMASVRLALWTLPFRWIKRAVESAGPQSRFRGHISQRKLLWAVHLASARIPHATCLTQAVTAHLLLNWAGLDGKLKIGIRCDSKFESHAWVESNGRIVVGDSEDIGKFVPMLTLDRS